MFAQRTNLFAIHASRRRCRPLTPKKSLNYIASSLTQRSIYTNIHSIIAIITFSFC